MLQGKMKTYLILSLLIFASYSASALANSMDSMGGISSFRLMSMSELAPGSCHDVNLDDSHWTRLRFPNLQAKQHLCIRARLSIKQTHLNQDTAILFLALAAYEVYLDGRKLGSNGRPGSSAELEQVGAISSLLPLNGLTLEPGEHLISLELSSFNLTRSFAAIAYDLVLVEQHEFYDTLIVVGAVTAAFIGALGVMFVIFLALYLRFNRALSFAVFSLLCLATALLLAVEQWKVFVNYQYDIHLLRLQLIIVLTLLVNGLLLFYYLVQQTMKNKKYWFLAWAISQTIAVMIAQSYDARSILLFELTLIFLLLINLLAAIDKKTGALSAILIATASLLALQVAPRLFIELGFGLSIILVLVSIGIHLLNQLITQRNLALESAKLKGELLRKNLQPHYLINCLMQVQELIDVAPKQANRFVEQLAQEFRALVSMSNKELVTLEQELALCRSHLKIMAVRYQKQYQLTLNCDDESIEPEKILVPTAIVHSQIENCFTHNKVKSEQSLELKVSCSQNRVTLQLITPVNVIADHKGLGIGEAYIRAKLAQSCEPNWQLQSKLGNGVWVTNYQYEPLQALINNEEAVSG